ncbi:hypothetical protein ALC56_12635 [Trachymyrmex septentrionalis]|uniref:Uncharacterized protein n=1 Tax=Trachymyrmex septentrionalis TaxID=34720 RepID=A0A195EXX6_9HYME|nr:hypothetical protein ALC56_12635 [Trachymyrmex septentrionalis]
MCRLSEFFKIKFLGVYIYIYVARRATWCASSRHRGPRFHHRGERSRKDPARRARLKQEGSSRGRASTRPRKGSHAVSGPLSIRLNPWGRTYGIRQRGDANVTSLRQITILLWDKRRSQLKRRVVNRILQNAKIDMPQT